MLFFEDYAIGQTVTFGRYEVTREEVLAFARAYDPQPFHLDDDAAAKTHFGRLAASGWHTCAMAMRMLVDAMGPPETSASLGAAGLDELRWLKPVHPGDTLRCTTEVLELTPSRSKPIGVVKSRMTVLNQHDEPVLTFQPIALVRRREG